MQSSAETVPRRGGEVDRLGGGWDEQILQHKTKTIFPDVEDGREPLGADLTMKKKNGHGRLKKLLECDIDNEQTLYVLTNQPILFCPLRETDLPSFCIYICIYI